MQDPPETSSPQADAPEPDAPQPRPLRLIFADDSPDLVDVFRLTVRRIEDIDLVATLGSADGVAAAVAEHRPDVLLIDLTMDGKPPLDAVRETTANHPEVRCVVYSGYDDDDTLRAVAAAGAVGFVSKHEDIADVLDAVRRVASGQTLRR